MMVAIPSRRIVHAPANEFKKKHKQKKLHIRLQKINFCTGRVMKPCFTSVGHSGWCHAQKIVRYTFHRALHLHVKYKYAIRYCMGQLGNGDNLIIFNHMHI